MILSAAAPPLPARLAIWLRCRYLTDSMGKKKATAAKRWRVSILRSRAHYLGVVEAPDLRAAEATAARTFKLSNEDRRRLAVREA